LFDHRSLTPERFLFSARSPSGAFAPFRDRWRKISFPIAAGKRCCKVLSDLPLRLPWQNKARDIGYITPSAGGARRGTARHSHLQVANELFYRNKAAWLVGKLVTPMATLPFCCRSIAATRGTVCRYLPDDHAEASIVFGFARSYFMVYAPLPGALVEWLREILPGKTTAELYMAIGCQKHAKTESYREYLHYIAAR
jgi:isocitrate dehydrogenase kinase/phosphatase